MTMNRRQHFLLFLDLLPILRGRRAAWLQDRPAERSAQLLPLYVPPNSSLVLQDCRSTLVASIRGLMDLRRSWIAAAVLLSQSSLAPPMHLISLVQQSTIVIASSLRERRPSLPQRGERTTSVCAWSRRRVLAWSRDFRAAMAWLNPLL